MEQNRKGYHATIVNRKRVFSMYLDALSDSLSRLCDEAGLTYEAASRRCRCSPQYFSAIIRRKSVPSIAVLGNLCNGFGKTPDCLSPDMEEESYRTPMRVEAVRAFRWGNGFSAFPICPRCQSTMEREYQAFCDRCGQRLSWRGFRRAAILMPPSETREIF